jgi:hypothetical protein
MSQITVLRKMLTDKINEESLCIYLFIYAIVYDTILVVILAQRIMFCDYSK